MESTNDIIKIRPAQIKNLAKHFGNIALKNKYIAGLKKDVFSAIEEAVQKEMNTNEMVISFLRNHKITAYVDVRFMFWLTDIAGYIETIKATNLRTWKKNNQLEPKYMFADVLRLKTKISDSLDRGDIVIVTEVNSTAKIYKIHNTINDKTNIYSCAFIDNFSELSTKI